MDPSDPYHAPSSDVAPTQTNSGRTTRYLLAALAFAQLLVWLFSYQSLSDLARVGAISPLALLVCLLAAASLAIAGLLVTRGSRLSLWLYAAASFFAAAVIASVPLPAVKAALLIALVSTAITWLLPGVRRGAA